VERQRQAALDEVRERCDEKRRVLEEQLDIIRAERSKVDSEVKAVQHEVEVRNITKKISDLNCKLDTVSALSEPRENCYLEFRSPSSTVLGDKADAALKARLTQALDKDTIGRVCSSRTLPSLCRCTMGTVITHLECTARVTTVDYEGNLQREGGDPVCAEVVDDVGEQVKVTVQDNDDGSYEMRFTPHRATTHCLKVTIFDRPIRDCPLFFDVTGHNAPTVSFGSHGTKDKGFAQPCNVAVDDKNNIFVVDTGNARIKRLTANLDFVGHLVSPCLEGRSATGICIGRQPDDEQDTSLLVINWRTKTVAEISSETGEELTSFTHEDLREPIDLALDSNDRILVADNALGALLVFQRDGSLVRAIGPAGPVKILSEEDEQELAKAKPKKQQKKFKDLSAVCVAPNGDYVAADSGMLFVFSAKDGELKREFSVPGFPKGRFGGLICDDHGFLLATHTVKKQSFLQVLRFESGELYSSIDSHGCRMKRPTGLAVTHGQRELVVVDIGFECVRKYRYF